MLDVFRGFAVTKLILSCSVYDFLHAPAWLQHAPGDGYRFPDVGAVLFLFATGMALPISLKSRSKKYGSADAIVHILIKGCKLIIFGTIGGIFCYNDLHLHWGTFEMIGGCLLISTPLIMFLSPLQRFKASFSIIIGWFIANLFCPTLGSIAGLLAMGGPTAAIAWSPMVLMGSAISEFYRSDSSAYVTGQRITAVGLFNLCVFLFFATRGIPPNKTLVNAPYLTLSAFLACAGIIFFERIQHSRIIQNVFIPFGRNSFVIYAISGVLNQLALGIAGDAIAPHRLFWVAFAQITLSSMVAFWLYSKDLVVTL
ncbi:MAG: DUF5009 domain-containing protein [Patescibacteria group bacterium]|nr:DUF5009 domain-containing protein [Patescibacteria group bacterium]